jgi:quercetin dioxygenase-like cupin family protein
MKEIIMFQSLSSTPVHATPAAEMNRYPGTSVAVWRSTTQPSSAGPVHTIDREHVVVVVEGTLTANVDEETLVASAGDAIVLPAGAVRQLRNDGPVAVVTITAAIPGSQARVGDGDPVTVPWSA